MYCKNLFLLAGCFFSLNIFASTQSVVASFALGSNNYTQTSNQTLIISDFIFDTLVHSKQHLKPAALLSIHKVFKPAHRWIKTLEIGPAFYYQMARFNGKVFELNDPEFYNYQYQLSANNAYLMVEALAYGVPFKETLTPFALLGVGMAHNVTGYREVALPGIAANTRFDLADKTNNCPAGMLGAGLVARLNERLHVQLRYVFTYAGTVSSSLSPYLQKPVRFNQNNQALYLGFSVRL